MPICSCCLQNFNTDYEVRKHKAENRARLVARIAAARAQRNAGPALEPNLGDDMLFEDDNPVPEPAGANDPGPHDDPPVGDLGPLPVDAAPLPPGLDLEALIEMEVEDIENAMEPDDIDWGVEENLNDRFVLPPDAPAPPPAAYRNHPVVIEDWESEEELDPIELEDIESDHSSVSSAEQELEFHEHDGPLGVDADNEPEMDDNELQAYLREHLGDIAYEEWIEIFERDLTERDRKTLGFLAARLRSHFSRATYDDLRLHVCEELGLPSDFVAWRRLKMLAGLTARKYDCCLNSCICYLGKHQDLDTCPHCKTSRFTAGGKPRRTFTYTPLIPQLIGLFQNAESVKNMRHRANHADYRARHPGIIGDVFDGEIYQTLRQTQVDPGDNYRYFDNPTDIALGLGTDGFNMFKRRRRRGKSTAWPLILTNYNLHSSIRTRLENIICVGVIPGPTDCKDINSFLVPLVEELLELAKGVDTVRVAVGDEALQGNIFPFKLRAFLIILFGDIPAISKLLMMRGHNAITPCRTCLWPGTPYHGQTVTYYVPLTPPKAPEDGQADVLSPDEFIPFMRSHDNFLYYYGRLSMLPESAARTRLSQECGLHGRPVLASLKSIDLSSCAPYEMMHLIFENLIPNMVKHWKGTFKWITQGDEPYIIARDAWKTIGERTAAATKTIPAQFVGTIPDIDKDFGLYKAEAHSFWFTHLAPVLLNGVLPNEYYVHFLAMREIIIWCLELEITLEQVDALEEKIRDWVQGYERLYYRYEHDRLPACALTIHALFHIPYYIRRTGPLSATWSFVMERFCGYLLRPALMNRVRPYEFLDNFIRRRAQMQIVAHVHDMPSLIRPNTRLTLQDGELISTKEVIYAANRDYVLGQPINRRYHPSDELKRRFTRYFGLAEEQGRRGLTYREIHDKIDWDTLVRHGRFRMASMGDRVRAARLVQNSSIARDNSFVRYEVLPDQNYRRARADDVPHRVIQYGRVQDIFYVEYKQNRPIEKRKPYLLALVQECNTNGLDATLPENPLVTYNRLETAHIINLGAVHAAVGRIKVGGRNTWAIVDRSRGARTQFNNDDGIPDPDLNPELY
ncbi:Transposase family tnp2 [Ceratobasidium sp. AG-Ba]|nr:Transposase family tnp2 [Ceratobasidium sp. AG-Ba]